MQGSSCKRDTMHSTRIVQRRRLYAGGARRHSLTRSVSAHDARRVGLRAEQHRCTATLTSMHGTLCPPLLRFPATSCTSPHRRVTPKTTKHPGNAAVGGRHCPRRAPVQTRRALGEPHRVKTHKLFDNRGDPDLYVPPCNALGCHRAANSAAPCCPLRWWLPTHASTHIYHELVCVHVCVCVRRPF
jgi:hypothetical protein